MKKILEEITFILFCLFLTFAGMVSAKTVYVKSGEEFTSWNKISDATDFTAIIQTENVGVIRKIPGSKIVIDNNINVLFKNDQEREEFLAEITKKEEKEEQIPVFEILIGSSIGAIAAIALINLRRK